MNRQLGEKIRVGQTAGQLNLSSYSSYFSRKLEKTCQRMKENAFPDFALKDFELLISLFEDLEFRLTVVGAFSRGKSTLLNSFLGENVLLTDFRPTTSVVTEVCYGAAISVRAWNKLGELVESHEGLELKKAQRLLVRFTTVESSAAHERYSRVRITYPSTFLPKGLVLVDTPGIGSIIDEHDELTKAEIARSDGVIILLCIDPTIGKSEKVFFDAHINSWEKTLCVLNKIDQVAYDPTTIRTAVHYISKHLNLTKQNVVPTSALTSLQNSSPDAYKKSGMEALLRRVSCVFLSGGPCQAKIARLIALVEETMNRIEAALVSQKNVAYHAEFQKIRAVIQSLEEIRERQQEELATLATGKKHEITRLKSDMREKAANLISETETRILDAKRTVDVQEVTREHQQKMGLLIKQTHENFSKLFHSFREDVFRIEEKEIQSLQTGLTEKGIAHSIMFSGSLAGASGLAGACVYASLATTTTLFGSTGVASVATAFGLGGLCTTVVPSLLAMTGVGLVVGLPIGIGVTAYLNKRRLKRTKVEATERIEDWTSGIVKDFLQQTTAEMHDQFRKISDESMKAINSQIEGAEQAWKKMENQFQKKMEIHLTFWKKEKGALLSELAMPSCNEHTQ